MDLSEDLLDALMRRIDPLEKERVNYSEFVELLTPYYYRPISGLRSSRVVRTALKSTRNKSSRIRYNSLNWWYNDYLVKSAEKKRLRKLEDLYKEKLLI